MFYRLTANVGKSIKILSKALYIVQIAIAIISLAVFVISFIAGIVFVLKGSYGSSIAFAVAGSCFGGFVLFFTSAIVSMLFLYGFGELIESNAKIAFNTSNGEPKDNKTATVNVVEAKPIVETKNQFVTKQKADFIKKMEEKIIEEENDNSSYHKCPNCGHVQNYLIKRCLSCGQMIEY
jgi:predicted membrane protein